MPVNLSSGGTRLTVEYVLKLLAHGATAAEIIAELGGLSTDDIAAFVSACGASSP
jgi:uncharacterized protein (DUF433 family)